MCISGTLSRLKVCAVKEYQVSISFHLNDSISLSIWRKLQSPLMVPSSRCCIQGGIALARNTCGHHYLCLPVSPKSLRFGCQICGTRAASDRVSCRMAKRLRGCEISRPKPIIDPPLHQDTPKEGQPSPPNVAKPHPADKVPTRPAWPNTSIRPLSDIRELTEPSLIDLGTTRRSTHARNPRSTSRASPGRHTASVRLDSSVKRAGSGRIKEASGNPYTLGAKPGDPSSSSSYSSTPPGNIEIFAIPQSSVPRRSSSFGHSRHPSESKGHARKPSIRAVPTHTPPSLANHSIPNHGPSRSPVKDVGLRLDPITSDIARRVPSRTFVRSPQPLDILDFPSFKHHRMRLEVQATAPVFVGGGSIEGFVRVTVDDNERQKHRRTLGIGSLCVDLLGFEDACGNQRSVFLALGTDVIDARHPPPVSMAEPTNPLTPGDKFWTLSPSHSTLPFMISLPLDTGPPPFQSKQASIRFLLCATALIRDAGNHYRVRTSQEVHILPTYDPEKALSSLPSPLTASDELRMPRGGAVESVKVTAGLHRQVWVSGSTVFVDVHVVNKCRKPVKRLDLSLERNILCYKHAAAATKDSTCANHSRVFESNHQSLVAMSSLRSGANGWSGVDPYASQTRTCDLELPRGHATVRCGKYFEVRYFLTVSASVSNAKLVTLQLPIILIHMNSLDVLPNSVAQVAAAIEEKRAAANHHRHHGSDSRHAAPTRHRSVSSPARIRRKASYTQGRAFAAPRQQSLDRQRAERAHLDELRHLVDSSPRKNRPLPPPPPQIQSFTLRNKGSNTSLGGRPTDGGGVPSTFRAMAFRSSSTTTTPESHPRPRRPPSPPPPPPASCGAEGVNSIRERMRRMRSFDSPFGGHNHATTTSSPPPLSAGRGFGPWCENVPPCEGEVMRVEPYALGLSGGPRMDRGRFEFKGVRRKGSVGLKERTVNWWRGRERDGWI